MKRATSNHHATSWSACEEPPRSITTTASRTGEWPPTAQSPTTMLRRFFVAVATLLLLLSAPAVSAQTPSPTPGIFGFGRPATPDDLQKIDIDVRADGTGLPPGSGT